MAHANEDQQRGGAVLMPVMGNITTMTAKNGHSVTSCSVFGSCCDHISVNPHQSSPSFFRGLSPRVRMAAFTLTEQRQKEKASIPFPTWRIVVNDTLYLMPRLKFFLRDCVSLANSYKCAPVTENKITEGELKLQIIRHDALIRAQIPSVRLNQHLFGSLIIHH